MFRFPIEKKSITPNLSLFIPQFEEIQPIYTSQLKNDPSTPLPLWAKIWPASLALVNFLTSQKVLFQDKTVLEVGAGLGLPSFSIADFAKQVYITDNNEDAIQLIQHNIQSLQIKNGDAKFFDWSKPNDFIPADIVLLSDINYDQGQFDALSFFINHYLKMGSTIILSTPDRIVSSPFIQLFEKHIQFQQNDNILMDQQSTAVGVFILQK